MSRFNASRRDAAASCALLVALSVLTFPLFAQDIRTYAFEPLNVQFPEAQFTGVSARNDKDEVVGYYIDPVGVQGAFLYTGGSFVSINAVNAMPRDINNKSEVAGYFTALDRWRGFIFRNGEFEAVDVPGATNTYVLGISNQGHLTGLYYTEDSAALGHGFVMLDGLTTIVDVPGAIFTNPTHVNANGEVVGVYTNDFSTFNGFHWRDGVYTTFTAPGAGDDLTTQANGINDNGVIVGVRLNQDQQSQGFVLVNNQFSPVHVPGALGESALSINNRGEILGEYYSASSNPRAFVAYPAIQVEIDIMPGSFTNTIVLGSNEKVRVVILSSATFDATTVNPFSAKLAGTSVAMRGNSAKPKVWTKDTSRDGLVDLILEFEASELQLSESDTSATLQGRTFGGAYIAGSDSVRVIP